MTSQLPIGAPAGLLVGLLVSLLVGSTTAGCSDGQITSLAPDGSVESNPGQTTGGTLTGGSQIGSGGGSSQGQNECEGGAIFDVGPSALRRLTKTEYARTLQQLFELDATPAVDAVPNEAERDGFGVHTNLQTLSAQHLRAYLQEATNQANALLADPERVARVIRCEPTDANCLRTFVGRFGRLAYRRPLTADEVNGLVTAAKSDALGALDGVRYAIETLLVSPNFLYRVELGPDPALASATPQSLTAYELASRMSFSLLGRAPSAALLDKAASGALQSPSDRATAAASLLADEAFPEFYKSFFSQWLGYAKLISPKEPPPGWDEQLLVDMQAETDALIEQYAWHGRPFFDSLTSDQTWVTPALAEFYDLPTPSLDGYVEIPAGHPRSGAGLLTHASLLSKKTDGDQVALRGNWLRSTFLCRGLHIPEAIAATFGERLVGLTHTEIVRERNADPACSGCHAAIDPIGVGLDAFDATGRFDPTYVRPDYGIEPALPDAPNPSFNTVDELSVKLKNLPEVTQCLTRRTFLFAYGREPGARDRCTLAAANEAFVASNHDYKVLVQTLLNSSALHLRRAPAAPTPGTNTGGSL